jgi:hypothetical protein
MAEIDAAASSPLRIEMPAALTRCGETFEATVSVYTAVPLNIVGVRIESDPAKVRLVSWALGSGLESHIEENGEPPACDIIVYPDGSRMFSVMVLDVPYSSAEHGTEWLKLTYEATAETPMTTCLRTLSSTDYDPDQGARGLGGISTRLHCVPVLILAPVAFLRGDSDGSGGLDIADAIAILDHAFGGGQAPRCMDAADADDDGRLSLGDAISILQWLFLEPAGAIGAGCARDATRDRLPNCRTESC